jgi:hypothetical protein
MPRTRTPRGAGKANEGGPVLPYGKVPITAPGPSWRAWSAGYTPDLTTRKGCLVALADVAAARLAHDCTEQETRDAVWTIGRALADHTRLLIAGRADDGSEIETPEPTPSEDADGAFERMIRAASAPGSA